MGRKKEKRGQARTLQKDDKSRNQETVVRQALEQLGVYSGDKKLRKSIGKTKLIHLVLVFSGTELVYIDEAPQRGGVVNKTHP